jgi:hypothetical protein
VKLRSHRGPVARAGGAVLTLGGCSAGFGPFGESDAGPARDYAIVRDWKQLAKDQPKIRAVQASDLVAADGRCAGETARPSPALNFQAGPSASRGDPYATIRNTDKVEISATESGARKVVLTYVRSDHADIYQFADGPLRLRDCPSLQIHRASRFSGGRRRPLMQSLCYDRSSGPDGLRRHRP